MAQTKIEQGLLKFTEATDYLKIPTGTTAQRPSSPANGYIRFNTTINDVEAYNGTAWTRMGVAPPTFTSVDYPGSATALDPAGDESLVINGTNFNPGITITIGGTTPSSITRNSSTQLTVTTPAKTAGTYDIVFTNTDGGTATATNAVSYNGIPAFTNAAGSLGSVEENSTVSLSAAATEPDGGAITYAITSGSLPSGLSLNSSTGAITGTAPAVSADTTSNFTVTATDNENQTASRAYSITVTNVLPSGNFNTVLYTGNGSTQSITGVGFQPDLVWIKIRDAASSHVLIDSTRGVQKYLGSNTTSAEQTSTDQFASFDTGGFTLGANAGAGGNTNQNGNEYVAWCFKANGGTTSSNTDGTITSTVQANNTLGFSIVKYTGNNTANATIGHGLSSTPQFIISKNLDNGSAYWATYHHSTGITKKLYLNDNSTGDTVSGGWLDVSSTLITLKQTNANNINENASDFINYCFTPVDGFSKIGSYTGNGSEDGTIIETGFEPAFILGRKVSGDNWWMFDNKRATTNPRNAALFPNLSSSELGGGYKLDFLSNGFQIKTTDGSMNTNGSQYIYIAFAADPNTTSPTLADSFNTTTYTGNGSSQSITGLGFKPNLVWIKQRNGTNPHGLWDSVRGAGKLLKSNTTEAETGNTGDLLGSFDSDGFQVNRNYLQYTAYDNTNYNPGTYGAWAWKADDALPTIDTEGSVNSIVSANANAGISIVKHTAPSTEQNYTIGHGLSQKPDMVMLKRTDAGGGWFTWHKDLSQESYYLYLHESYSESELTQDTRIWGQQAFTSTTISTRSNYTVSNSSEVIAYCFHSVSGFSKFGSYTGTGSTGNAQNVGFAPGLVILKSTNATTSWAMFDTARGANVLYSNLSNAESSDSRVTLTSTGFEFTGAAYNESGRDWIYMAFKIN